ncbi:MAG: hypothetical protein MASP_00514 [Candidatus Methanolliviera sp. GoM_asphalt]|nr:MAG: hypothetical protein MASP_00514 [Candidatus Methanolliviera sp. GoM_asphalt]
MSEDELVKDEDKGCQMEDKINSIDAQFLNMQRDIDAMNDHDSMNRIIICTILSVCVIITSLWLSFR